MSFIEANDRLDLRRKVARPFSKFLYHTRAVFTAKSAHLPWRVMPGKNAKI